MGEPVEVVEGPNSEISRLFPKCRPRFSHRYSSAIEAHAHKSNAIYTQSNNINFSDLNRNCVVRDSDANDNYEDLPTFFPTTIDEEVTSLGDDSSGSSASRMSVDSASATPSSTPASHSSQSSHTQSNGAHSERNADLEADLSVVSAYRDIDDRFTSILDSSYEDSSGQRVTSPSSHQAPRGAPHVIPQISTHAIPQSRREHFRLRDSRIEAAGGREVFSQSRSRPSRRRHDETRRNHHHYHHHPHFPPQSHHPIPQQQPSPQQQAQPPQLARDEHRRRQSSSSRSNSTSSNSSSDSGSSESREPQDDDRNPTSSTATVGSKTSALVYETRLTGSSEVVFDDISDWVARGLTVRGVENPENIRKNIKKGYVAGEMYPPDPLTPPTPPSRSPSQSEHESDYGEEGESPTHVTKIGNVPIADYEGSPRRYGQSQRPPRPGFPRRVVGQEEGRSRPSKIIYGRDGKVNNLVSNRESSRPLLLPVNDVQKVQMHPTTSPSQKQRPLLDIPDLKIYSNQETSLKSDSQLEEAKVTDSHRTNSTPVEKDHSISDDRSEEESEASSLPPNAISISTLTSSYASTLTQIQPAEPTEPPPLSSLPEIYEGYGFEDSETRKVLEEFFLDTGKKRSRQQEFSDLEYVLKRQHGNSYVGQRLAAAECEEDKDVDDELCYHDQSLSQEAQACLQDHKRYAEERQLLQERDNYPLQQPSYPIDHVQQNQLLHVCSSFENETASRIEDTSELKVADSTDSPQTSEVRENGIAKNDTEQMGVSRNFTLSPETTSCDSLDVESEYSGGEPEGSLPSSGKVVSTMPVLEDGLSSGEESEMEIVANYDSKFFPAEDDQKVTKSQQQSFLEQQQQHIYLEQIDEKPYLPENDEEELSQSDVERGRVYQRVRSLDEQLCRGELLPMGNSFASVNLNHTSSSSIGSPPASLPSRPPMENGLYQNSCSSPMASGTPLNGNNFHDDVLPHATSSPHLKLSSRNKTSSPPPDAPHGVHSPSSSTLNLMKKQITEIEREIALKKPECGGHRKVGPEGEVLNPSLDLHLLDPLNEKMGEPPPPPAPHPHRGSNNEIVENGSSTSTPGHTSIPASNVISPSSVIGHIHSPQFTPVSGPVSGPQLLSTMGSLTSPIQIVPHMVSGHPATHDLHHKPGTGNGVSPSRESVEAAIADIKQAIRRTKNLPLKTHPQERHDKGPVWVPRNNRRDQQCSQQSSPTSPQVPVQQRSPQLTQNNVQQLLLESSPSVGSTRSRDRSIHDEDDGDTDQETDRLLGQQRSDDTGFLDEKSWRRLKSRTSMPRSLTGEPKEPDSEGGGGNSNDSSPSTPSHHGSSNQMPSSPHDLVTSNKIKAKKDKESGKKKSRSKEVLIEGVLFRARYLGSTQLVSEGQPTKTTRMMQAEEAVSRIKDVLDEEEEKLTENPGHSLTKMPSYSESVPSSPQLQLVSKDFDVITSASVASNSENSEMMCSSPLEGNNSSSYYAESPFRHFHETPTKLQYLPSPLHEANQMDVVETKDESFSDMEDSIQHALELLDRRLDEELAAYEEHDRETCIEPKDDCERSPLMRSASDENIYVNVSNLSFTEDEIHHHGDLDESFEELEMTPSRSLSFRMDDIDIRDADKHNSSEQKEGPWLSPEDEAAGKNNIQGNVAWIVDAGGGIGATGSVFHLRFVGSIEVQEDSGDVETVARKGKRPRKEMVMEAVAKLKALAPEGEAQPSTEVDLFISTEKIMVLNTDLKEIMMDHALRTISYIADIGDLVVLMARRRVLPTDDPSANAAHRLPKMICHVFESDEAQFIAQSIGQAFQVAYLEFLKANGIEDHSFVKEMDYQEVLNSQEIFGDELQMFAKKELQKEVVVPKLKGEILGVVVVESGWGSMVPTVVIANLSPTGAAAKCGQLNIGDQIIAINGISLVGLPLSNCQNYIKNTKYNTAVKLTVVPCPPVVEVKIRRPDTKYQLGFSVQNGVICSLLRGGIAERGGVRVGHRIIDINSQSVVAVPHEKIVNLLATSVGEIRMKTMPTSIFRLLTGQETPQYI